MFIRGLTSDMNAQEAAKKTKQLKGGGRPVFQTDCMFGAVKSDTGGC